MSINEELRPEYDDPRYQLLALSAVYANFDWIYCKDSLLKNALEILATKGFVKQITTYKYDLTATGKFVISSLVQKFSDLRILEKEI